MNLAVSKGVKCEHGKFISTEQCLKCFPDLDWCWKQIYREEFDSMLGYFGRKGIGWGCGPSRSGPYPMQYTFNPIMWVLLREYAAFRGWDDVKI